MGLERLHYSRMAVRHEFDRGVSLVEDTKTNRFYIQKRAFQSSTPGRTVGHEQIVKEAYAIGTIHKTYRELTGRDEDAPNVVTVAGVGWDLNGNPVLWTPYLSENTLSEVRFHSTPTVIRQLVDALDAIALTHLAGYDYYDAKPANFLDMIRRSRRTGYTIHDAPSTSSVMLIDFGSTTRRSGRTEEAHTFHGTPVFASPQRLLGLPDARADVFGVAAMGYQLLCDRIPYTIPPVEKGIDWNTKRANVIATERLSCTPYGQHTNELAERALDLIAKELHHDDTRRSTLRDFRNDLGALIGVPSTSGMRAR